MKEINIEKNIIKKIVIIAILLIAVVFVLIKAPNYIIRDANENINLIINNNNVTSRLKHKVQIINDIVYVSMDDIQNFFDKHIYEENEINEIVTTYETKVASIGFDVNKITINGQTKKTNASAIKQNNEVFLPISEMTEIYDMELKKTEAGIIIDSSDREQITAHVNKNVKVKWKKDTFSKTLERLEKGEKVVVISKDDKGWARVRTDNGNIGYIKISKLTNETKSREEKIETKQISGKVNMFWDYFSKYYTAPNRTGQVIEGVNVVSPTFFYIDDEGVLQENVGEAGIKYIEWAHSNGYKVWPMVANDEAGIKVTSNILNSYTKRQELIQGIVEKCIEYNLDGINIDFENIYQEDKDKYSRLIIELVPRMQDINVVTSVDVTAPDGAPNWSMCFDRNVIGDVADYLVFMAYDQHGTSSTKPGTTAGYNWVENSLKKIIEYDEVETEKIILAMPFYTRQWTINQNGEIKDKSVVSMMNTKIPNGVEKQWDDTLKQYYIEYKSGKNTIKMWIEDGDSIAQKVSLVTKYNLGGAACWRKDMETSNVWTVINKELKK